jgi:intein/homing endonuclease
MQNKRKPNYSELEQMYETEKRIKNHLYYFISMKRLQQQYNAHIMVYANDLEEKERQDGVIFRIIAASDSLFDVIEQSKKRKNVQVVYDVLPN